MCLNVLGSADSIDCAGDDLARTRTMTLIVELGLQQLGVGEDDAELVVQAVKQGTDLGTSPGGTPPGFGKGSSVFPVIS